MRYYLMNPYLRRVLVVAVLDLSCFAIVFTLAHAILGTLVVQ